MSTATADLRTKADNLRVAIVELQIALRIRDEAKRQLADVQSGIFVDKTNDGTIDGKNSETRDAQANIAYKQEEKWQTTWDAYLKAENAYQTARAEYEWSKTDLAVQATIVNAEIAQTGATRLLAEVSLASV